MRRAALVALAVAAAAFGAMGGPSGGPPAKPGPVPVVTRYRSPKNAERRVRKTTELIVLHTTEAPARGSLRHLSERGECHYCVTEDGTIYQIVDRYRVAFHAGRSMWNGREDVDEFSVGIECVGYHDKSMPAAQLKSIKALVKELQSFYSVPDHCVVTHSQVAYGDVNKWQKKKHRGRKRCAMLFAMPSVRAQLGLKSRAAFDPDVKAKRLVVGDDFLDRVLYGKTDTMRSQYGRAVIAGVDPTRKQAPAKPAAAKPGKSFKQIPQSIADLKRQGFVSIGSITKTRLPAQVAGPKWNAPDTYYTIRSKVIPGNIIDPRHVEDGMNVWRRLRQ